MSAVELNDENREVLLHGGKHCAMSDDIFMVANPTGRPSILRQTENLPSHNVPKGVKVCFQTPRRDPVTKRIVSPSKMSKMASVDECTKAFQSLQLDKNESSIHEANDQLVPKLDGEIQLSSSDYQLDFENLDAADPFQSSNKVMLSPVRPAVDTPPVQEDRDQGRSSLTKVEPALDDTLPFTPSVETSLNATVDISSTDSSVVLVTKAPAMEEQEPVPDVPSEKQDKSVENSPLPTTGSYNFDFNNLDAVNPFQTGGSKIQNSPMCKPSPSEKDSLDMVQKNLTEEVIGQEMMMSQPEEKPVATVAPIFDNTDVSSEPEAQPDTSTERNNPIKLEFNFSDDAVKVKPPPKKLGVKRPASQKAKVAEPVQKAEAQQAEEPREEVATQKAEEPCEEVSTAKGSYSFELGKLDDPNFNPFGSKASVCNSPSPKFSIKTSPESVKPVQEELIEPEPVLSMESKTEDVPVESTTETAVCEGTPPRAEHMNLSEPQSQGSLLEEEFVPGTTFLANDFDGQIDYLEQFGSSNFKESALRKQSLYLKFDPLLRESPKKGPGPAAVVPASRPAALMPRFETPMEMSRGQSEDFQLLDVATEPCAPVRSAALPLSSVSQETNTEEAIIEVLKYSQKDMDAAMARVQAETEEKERQWGAKYNKLHDDGQEMRKILAEYELLTAKIMADQEKEKELAQAKIKEALAEKDQVSSDLNAMERSFSDLFKRLEKYKTVIEGYKKNEETLKSCAQDYLARIKKEEQRYQTLKVHAEEKIGQANGEIAEVRSKFKSELSVLQAQLRREQLKVQSLERTLEQKEKEANELTKLCDELISNVQQG
ncbi:unnamed protein product [Knipowitschia caucasica]